MSLSVWYVHQYNKYTSSGSIQLREYQNYNIYVIFYIHSEVTFHGFTLMWDVNHLIPMGAYVHQFDLVAS